MSSKSLEELRKEKEALEKVASEQVERKQLQDKIKELQKQTKPKSKGAMLTSVFFTGAKGAVNAVKAAGNVIDKMDEAPKKRKQKK